MHLEVKIFPIEGGRWAVIGILIDENGLAVGGTGGLGTTYPGTWDEVVKYATDVVKQAGEQGVPEQMRDAHDLMLRKTKGE